MLFIWFSNGPNNDVLTCWSKRSLAFCSYAFSWNATISVEFVVKVSNISGNKLFLILHCLTMPTRGVSKHTVCKVICFHFYGYDSLLDLIENIRRKKPFDRGCPTLEKKRSSSKSLHRSVRVCYQIICHNHNEHRDWSKNVQNIKRMYKHQNLPFYHKERRLEWIWSVRLLFILFFNYVNPFEQFSELSRFLQDFFK